MQEHDARLGGTQHQHGIDGGQVGAFVEQIYREDDIELGGGQLLLGGLSPLTGARIDGYRPHSGLLEDAGHKIGMTGRDAEGQRALLA